MCADEDRLQLAKAEHAAAHPDYVYRPERKSKNRSSTSTSTRKSSVSRARRSSEDSDSSQPHLSVFVPMHPGALSHSSSPSTALTSTPTSGGVDRRHPGRSSSAPRPYHRIDVPRVSHGVYEGRQGSEPTSPSLVPLINEHSRSGMGGGGWDFVPSKGGAFGGVPGGGEYPSMSMVSSLFPSNSATHARKSSMPSPLTAIASNMGAVSSPLSMISPPSSSLPSSGLHSAQSQSQTQHPHEQHEGGGSDSSSESGSPYTPSSSAPTHAHAFGLMPSFEETLLEPPTTFDSSLLDPSFPSHPQGFNQNGGVDPMGMEGMMSSLDGEMHTDAYGSESAFGGWDWPAGEGTLDNEWDVNSIPLASLSPTSLSSLSPNSTTHENGRKGSVGAAASQLAAQFGGLGVGSPKGLGGYEGMDGSMGYAGGMGEMEYGADPTLIGVGGYDDMLAGGAFA